MSVKSGGLHETFAISVHPQLKRSYTGQYTLLMCVPFVYCSRLLGHIWGLHAAAGALRTDDFNTGTSIRVYVVSNDPTPYILARDFHRVRAHFHSAEHKGPHNGTMKKGHTKRDQQ
jgi:hypothetical protein